MKKLLISLVAVCSLFAFPAFSLEWGGLLNEEAKITKTSATSYNQSNTIYLWANSPVGKDFSFAAEGLFKYNLSGTFGADGAPVFSPIADLDLFKFSGNVAVGSGKCSISAGRFTIADNTGVNFSQCCDGVSASLLLNNLNISLYGGYTGLLNNLNITILGDTSEAKSVYSLCHGYIPLLAAVEIPSLFANQALAIQGEAFLDTASENKYDRYYANLTLGGPITGTVYYSLVTSFGFVNKNLMNYSSLTVSAYPNESIAVNAGASFATGDYGNGPFKAYTTFTSKTAYNSALYPETTGCIVPNVDFIYTIGNFFADVVLKTPLSMPAATDGSVKFEGVGADLVLIYNIFSDLQSEIDVTFYKDVAGSGVNDNLLATLKLVLSF